MFIPQIIPAHKINIPILCSSALSISLCSVSTQAATLFATDGGGHDSFGYSAAISGDNSLVAAIYDDDSGSNAGSAYFFNSVTTTTGFINESVKLIASDASDNDNFGWSTSLSGNNAIVGTIRVDDLGSNSGAAYFYTGLDSAVGTVTESAKLIASDGAASDFFGHSSSLNGDTALIGASSGPGNTANSGAAYLFYNLSSVSGTVTESAKLIASDGSSDGFGKSVSLSGNYAVVGANADDENGSNSGSAYFYSGLGSATGTLTENAKLVASDASATARFGFYTSLQDDNALVSAYASDENGTNSGSAYYFRNLDGTTGTVTEDVKLVASDAAAGDLFGFSTGLSNDTAIVGS